jgi:hypothetical protein
MAMTKPFEISPPGLAAVMVAYPADAINCEGTLATRELLELKVVLNGIPFQ